MCRRLRRYSATQPEYVPDRRSVVRGVHSREHRLRAGDQRRCTTIGTAICLEEFVEADPEKSIFEMLRMETGADL